MEKQVTQLITKINTFAYNNGSDTNKIFEGWLDFILHGITINAPVNPNWKFKEKENNFFHELYCDWLLVMQELISESKNTLWYDVFGEIYMEIVSQSKASSTGQFFTPQHVCDLMQTMTQGDDKETGKSICDPCCGSGRNLLSFHAHNLGNYVFGMDIDLLCCKMTVLNFWVHGCIGEVVCMNTLTMSGFNGCWQVERLASGIPAVKIVEKADSIMLREDRIEQLKEVVVNHPVLIPVQQSLF